MKWWQIGLIILVVFGAAFGLYKIASTPVPGEKKEDLGREHVSAEEVASYKYNSNPPTSGPHLETWVRAGIFDTQQSEGELIHSLEHGYVIISYNCNVHFSSVIPGLTRNLDNKNFWIPAFAGMTRSGWDEGLIQKVFAHEEGEESSSSADFVDPTISTASAMNETAACKDLVKQLSDVANANRLWKLAVVPRPQLDTTIALTAWGYLDKFDPPAGGVEETRIKKFIDYHRDHGPEQTME